MKIFSRISQLFKSNINSAIDKMSNPEKEVEYLITEMEREVKQSRLSLRDQMAEEKLMEKRSEEWRKQVKRFQEHAERSVLAGEDELAKEALKHLQDAEQKLYDAEQGKAEQTKHVNQLIEQIKQYEKKLAQIKQRKDTIKAQIQMSGARNMTTTNAFERFDSIASQIDQSEYEAEALGELAQLNQSERDRSTETKFERLTAGSRTDFELEDRLQQLKAHLGKQK